MIKEFVEQWHNRKHEIREVFSKRHPVDYEDLVRETIKILDGPDPEIIHKIDDGCHEGILVFIIAEKNDQFFNFPSNYFYVKVDYGSCSGCDALERIRDNDSFNTTPNESQTNSYMTLCLHIVQNLKKMNDDECSIQDEDNGK